jgi:hypothetical protein
MAVDFDQFPLYDPIIKTGTNSLSDIWVGAFSTFIQTLVEYLSQNGIFIPVLTTDQMNKIHNPVNGQVIYNSTMQKFVGREGGVWRTFTLV